MPNPISWTLILPTPAASAAQGFRDYRRGAKAPRRKRISAACLLRAPRLSAVPVPASEPQGDTEDAESAETDYGFWPSSVSRRLLRNSSRAGQRLAYLLPGLKRIVTLRGPAKSPRYLGFL